MSSSSLIPINYTIISLIYSFPLQSKEDQINKANNICILFD